MENKEWEEYRNTAVFMHAVNTIGATMFARVTALILLSETPVTRESFDAEIHSFLSQARELKNNDDYFQLMLAHAFFDRNVTHEGKSL